MLIHNAKQLPLLKEDRRQDRLVAAQDIINNRFGERTIKRARVVQGGLRTKIGGFKEPNQFDDNPIAISSDVAYHDDI